MDLYQKVFLSVLGAQMVVSIFSIYRSYVNGKKIEILKKEYIKAQARYQSELDLFKDRKSKTFSQSQQAIIDYYKEVTTWIERLLAIHPAIYETETDSKVNGLFNELNLLYANANVTNAIMNLLVDDDEISIASQQLILDTLNFQHYIEHHIDNAKNAVISFREMQPNISPQAIERLPNETRNEVTQIIDNINQQKGVLYQTFAEGQNINFKNILDKQEAFRSLATGYLNN